MWKGGDAESVMLSAILAVKTQFPKGE
jgi:hypothetical protein